MGLLEAKDIEIDGRRLIFSPKEIADQAVSPKGDVHAPVRNIFQLPEEIADSISKLVKQNPGCNISQIPGLLKHLNLSSDVSFVKYGFKNLHQALTSLQSIYIEAGTDRSKRRPAYYAYPKS